MLSNVHFILQFGIFSGKTNEYLLQYEYLLQLFWMYLTFEEGAELNPPLLQPPPVRFS